MVGALLAGMIAQHWGWRAVFFCFGIPGLLVACATWFGLTEPPRGLADGAGATRAPPPPMRVVISHIWNTASLRWIVIGGSICSIGIQGVAQFMVLYFVRSFGMPVRSAAALFGLLSGLSLAVGLVLGAFGTDRASAREPRWWVLAPALALVLTTACFVVGFRSGSINLAVVLIGLGCLGAMIHYGPTVGLIQNLTPVNMRSSTSAVFAMLYALAGTGIGPTFVGFFSDRIAAGSFAREGYLARHHRAGHGAGLRRGIAHGPGWRAVAVRSGLCGGRRLLRAGQPHAAKRPQGLLISGRRRLPR